jgi:hypothetical protein
MDELLQGAIAARLAAEIAFPLTNSATTSKTMWELYNMKLEEARQVDAFEGTSGQLKNDDWVNSRL